MINRTPMIDRNMLVDYMSNSHINFDKLLDMLVDSINKDGYILQYHNETALIFDTNSDLFVSWYKLGHIGRSLITNIKTSNELLTFVNDLKENLDL